MTLDETYQNLGLTRPTPSLCDVCKHSYYMPGGMVFIGGEPYAQRYCSACTINISINGKQECEKYVPEPWAKLP